MYQDEGSRLLWFIGGIKYAFQYNSSNVVVSPMAKLPSNIATLLAQSVTNSTYSGAMGTHVCSIAAYNSNSNILAVRATSPSIAQMSFDGNTYEWGISLGANANCGTTKWSVISMVNCVCAY